MKLGKEFVINFDFISIHPEFIASYLNFGVMGQAREKGICDYTLVNLRDYGVDSHGSVDGAPYGGGDGMVMRCEPLVAALEKSCRRGAKVVYTSPGGERWSQHKAASFAQQGDDLIFVSGRFGGIDERFIENYVDFNICLGDFVISGGELASLTIADSIVRLMPGVLGNHKSSELDSFCNGYDGMLEEPLYTRPAEFQGESVPKVLLSGNHSEIEKWRLEQRQSRTANLRPDLLPLKS